MADYGSGLTKVLVRTCRLLETSPAQLPSFFNFYQIIKRSGSLESINYLRYTITINENMSRKKRYLFSFF